MNVDNSIRVDWNFEIHYSFTITWRYYKKI